MSATGKAKPFRKECGRAVTRLVFLIEKQERVPHSLRSAYGAPFAGQKFLRLCLVRRSRSINYERHRKGKAIPQGVRQSRNTVSFLDRKTRAGAAFLAECLWRSVRWAEVFEALPRAA